MKLDGDIELPPAYLRELIARFAADPQLGLAGGVLDEPTADGGMRPHPDRPRPRPRRAQVLHARLLRGHRRRPGAPRLGHDRRDLRAHARLRHAAASPTSCRSITGRSAAPTARCAATRATASAPTSRTTRLLGLAAPLASHAAGRAGSRAPLLYGYAAAVLRRQPRIDDPELRRFVRRQLRLRVRREAGAAIAALLVSRRPRRA